MFLWGICLRVVVGLHATWLVNSATHMWGSRRFDTRDDSRNNWWVALITLRRRLAQQSPRASHFGAARPGLVRVRSVLAADQGAEGLRHREGSRSRNVDSRMVRTRSRVAKRRRKLAARLAGVAKLEAWNVTGRRKSIAFFIALGVGLISHPVRSLRRLGSAELAHGILLFLGILLLPMIICGVVLNTIFLVREIRRNEQHDAFINAVTHELKTPVASIRLYLETLQTRAVDEAKRKEFYRIMLEDSDRLLATIEQILRTGRIGRVQPHAATSSRIDLDGVVAGVRGARAHAAPRARRSAALPARAAGHRSRRSGRSARRGLEPDRQRREVFAAGGAGHGGNGDGGRDVRDRCG